MTDGNEQATAQVAELLVALYDRSFGGKRRGRFRISMKLMRRALGVRRVWPEQIEAIRRELYERGYVLLDMETYFAVVSQQTCASYRRVNDAALAALLGAPPPPDELEAAAD